MCPKLALLASFSYTGDEFKSGFVIGLGGAARILGGAQVDRGLWRPERGLEEIGDFGESTKGGGIGVLDKPLIMQ